MPPPSSFKYQRGYGAEARDARGRGHRYFIERRLMRYGGLSLIECLLVFALPAPLLPIILPRACDGG